MAHSHFFLTCHITCCSYLSGNYEETRNNQLLVEINGKFNKSGRFKAKKTIELRDLFICWLVCGFAVSASIV